MLKLVDLDKTTREFMLVELEQDVANNSVFMSPRLNERGAREYVQLLREAISMQDDAWLANKLRTNSLLSDKEQRRKPKGGIQLLMFLSTRPRL